MQLQLILIRGLPGSGKSTLARYLATNTNMIHLEADQYFINAYTNEYVYVPEKIQEAHHYCQNETARYLQEGKSVVVSNTFTRFWEIQPYIELSNKFAAVRTILTCKGEWQNIHGVPADTIENMKRRWEDF